MNEYGKLTAAIMALSKTVRTVTNSDYFIIEAHALSRELKPIVVHGGFERGMTDNGQPAWSEHDTATFKTEEEAVAYSRHLGTQMWGFMVDPLTIKAKRVVRRQIEYYDEYSVDDANRIIQEHHHDYMESR